ncbi:alpha-amylase family glycosyl hydrolase [Photobacterium sp. DNB23_23_1]|uniref:Alpha-amylase n=1 Tax=Photobacterium pectinilyticum TaxID=2906793 RepID=A0ABT1N3J4_9GAMM|nr:alpha-amylase family glycosyl hydrolase [Photobacterium sp. ZSDE20]MCQ1059302.1 alpha-amylase family glycosyl hydrolase [Photobacterium sp. ZSDE20]MDD1824737.1 alpha-amylase [Photobacterium sp. ZSDE20]
MTTSNTTQTKIKATNVILHAFDWPYNRVTQYAKKIASSGYKAVLVSPPLKSYKHESGTEWWQRYQPQDYRVIDNQLGNTEDFRKMTAVLNEYDVHVYVDVVFNHMANESHLRHDLNFPSNQVLDEYQQSAENYEKLKLFGDLTKPLFSERDFIKAFPIQNWTDPWEVQHGRISGSSEDPGLPTLKCNQNVVKQQKCYINSLKRLGIKGFRIDAAKHLTLEHIQLVWDKKVSADVHIFGEIITDGGATKEEYELFLAPYLKGTSLGAYDFPLFHAMYNVFEKGQPMAELDNPYSVGQALAYDRAITFAITHDIPNNDVFLDQVMTEQNEIFTYCYILGRDGGVPLIYSDLDTSKITNSNGLPRWKDRWSDSVLTQMISFHNLMQSLPMAVMSMGEDHLVFSRGSKGIVAINRGDKPLNIELPVGQFSVLMDSSKIEPSSSCEVSEKYTVAACSCTMLVHLSC